jgi:hypothetical protein
MISKFFDFRSLFQRNAKDPLKSLRFDGFAGTKVGKRKK